MFFAGFITGALIAVVANWILIKLIIKHKEQCDFFRKYLQKDIDTENK